MILSDLGHNPDYDAFNDSKWSWAEQRGSELLSDIKFSSNEKTSNNKKLKLG